MPTSNFGGYRRRLKKKESSKGFTLVELIVVIVILAILAAILIPGLLKWIDEAKDKKYELEAREIALAAEAAMAKLYAGSIDVESVYEENNGKIAFTGSHPDDDNFMNLPGFRQEIEKLTDLNVENIKGIIPYGKGVDNFAWGGDISGYKIYFVSDGVTIKAYYMRGPEIEYNGNTYNTPTDGWIIEKNPSNWGPGMDIWNPDRT